MLRKFTYDSFFTFAKNIINFIIALLISIIIARILGPEKKGIYVLLFIVPKMAVMLFNFGLKPSIIYHKGRLGLSVQQTFNKTLPVSLALSSMGFLTSFIVIWILKDSFFNAIPFNYLILSILTIPIGLISNMMISFIYSEENFTLINIYQISLKVLTFSLILGIFIFESIFYLLIINLFTSLLSFVTLFCLVVIKNKIAIKPEIDWGVIKKIVTFGLNVNLSNIVTFFHYKIDIMLINAYMTPTAVGFYSLSANTSEKVWIFSSSISTVLYPRLANISDKQKKYITPIVSRIVFFFSLIGVFILYLAADKLIPLLYSYEFYQSVLPLKILLFGILMIGLSRILSNDLAARGKPKITLITKFLAFVLNIVLNIILIPYIGIEGAALATTISYTCNTIAVILIYSKLTGNSIPSIIFMKQDDILKIIGVLRK